MEFGAVSWLAVLVAGVAFFLLGGLWYGPVFGDPWMRASGVTEEQARQSNLPMIFGATFVLEIVAAYGLAAVIGPDAGLATGLGVGAGVALLIVVPVLAVLAIYERRRPVLVALNAGYNLVGFVVMGAIIGGLQ